MLLSANDKLTGRATLYQTVCQQIGTSVASVLERTALFAHSESLSWTILAANVNSMTFYF